MIEPNNKLVEASPLTKSSEFGASFSIRYAQDFGLDWQAVLLSALKDLKIRRFRLMSHWPLIEPSQGDYTWVDLDWQMDQVAKHRGIVNLAIGLRQPHYPECHAPEWYHHLPDSERGDALTAFVEQVIKRYRKHPAIFSWHLENEALNRGFGECDDFDRGRLRKEFKLVKKLDPKHPIVMSLSNTWGLPLRQPQPDRYAMSIYLRQHHNGQYTDQKFSPNFQKRRAGLIKLLTGKSTFIHELQAEPWGPTGTQNLSRIEQAKSMDAIHLQKNIDYAVATGLFPIDLWGLEWWYWRRQKYHDESIWRVVKKLYSGK